MLSAIVSTIDRTMLIRQPLQRTRIVSILSLLCLRPGEPTDTGKRGATARGRHRLSGLRG